jgi:hypothetical protein
MLFRPVCKANILFQKIENEVLLYDLNNHKAHSLNQTSALVYGFCDGTNSVVEISELMSKELKTLVSEDLVWLALKQLKRQDLLENAEDLTHQVAGLSRRELLKKGRLPSLVLLPLIITLVAPTSMMAASCTPFLAPCSGPLVGTCCPGSLCVQPLGICGCSCVSPGDCLVQTLCPSTVNCNSSGVCAP